MFLSKNYYFISILVLFCHYNKSYATSNPCDSLSEDSKSVECLCSKKVCVNTCYNVVSMLFVPLYNESTDSINIYDLKNDANYEIVSDQYFSCENVEKLYSKWHLYEVKRFYFTY